MHPGLFGGQADAGEWRPSEREEPGTIGTVIIELQTCRRSAGTVNIPGVGDVIVRAAGVMTGIAFVRADAVISVPNISGRTALIAFQCAV